MTIRTRVARARILRELAEGPLSANELGHRLWLDVMNTWAAWHGYEWNEEDCTSFDRLRAHGWWRSQDELGPPLSLGNDVYRHLRAMEKRGEVGRLEIEGHRPILWQLA